MPHVMSACTRVVRRMNTSFSPLYPYHARATPLPCSISAWCASERLRGVLICAVVVARRCFKWPVPTSLATTLAATDARCHSFLLCASVVWVICVPSGVFYRMSVFVCLFVENGLKACGLPHCSENAVELAFYEAVERRACKYMCRVFCRCVRGDVALDGPAAIVQ